MWSVRLVETKSLVYGVIFQVRSSRVLVTCNTRVWNVFPCKIKNKYIVSLFRWTSADSRHRIERELKKRQLSQSNKFVVIIVRSSYNVIITVQVEHRRWSFIRNWLVWRQYIVIIIFNLKYCAQKINSKSMFIVSVLLLFFTALFKKINGKLWLKKLVRDGVGEKEMFKVIKKKNMMVNFTCVSSLT